MSWTFVSVTAGQWKSSQLGQNNVKPIKGEGNWTKTALNTNAPTMERHFDDASPHGALM